MVDETRKIPRPWVAVTFLCLAVFIAAIDDGVLNLALPSISREFQASTGEMQWTINAYLLAFTTLLLPMGALGDRIGRKKMLHVGLILFGLSSLAAALSTSMGMLIASRTFMGAGAAIVVPQTLSIIRATFTDPKQRVQAIGLWAGVYGLGYGVGPVVGGVLLEYFDWYSVFLLNIPIVIIALQGRFFIMESKDEQVPRQDLPGIILSVSGLFSLVYGIIKAGETSWTEGSVLISLSIGIIIMGMFILWEIRTDHPMLPMKFFKNMSFTGADMAMVITSFSTGALLFFVSQYFQSVQGYSPLESALRLLPTASITMLASVLVTQIARKIGFKLPISFGVLIGGIGLFCLSLVTVNTSYWGLLPSLVLMGVGFGLAWGPATDSVLGSVPENRAGVGSATDSAMQVLGTVLGIAVLGAIMNAIYLNKVEDLTVMASLPPWAQEAVRSSIQGAHIVAGQFPADVSQQIVDGSSRAFTSGMTQATLVGAIVLIAASLIVFCILPTRIRPPQE
jgi:EmrB/QacA subfamily drug resistance transporter